ncbi:DNA polymerase III subunit gamma/tau [Sphingomonas sp. NSE70-1]|uniref:DNA polymerase III subunit gamma/tau n=1 Tax=Sphingomonas caseinilyticus TaxID=2908205 RepID=A0ABT0RR79_9SPHN|nr:DNA polymerase III subunit gamma/tau [Sphingomonas caseinilyticus]MCL6697517.1 DNA polymerase III subunit gamma/tau [Sphingomonas caseinilyticus]
MDDESPGLGLDLPEEVKKPDDETHYRVLARKYRPQTFAELIGQDAMVQTLGNAIERGRIAHAFLLTGVRGVGKTSTARLVAKALNCIGPDGQGGPTINPCGVCEPCRAIAEGRHIDVIEMDAASHTGVDDVREIIEAVRYASVSARYKIYIIDEVHMLSKSAFNALLKTLEEPPAHVKFLFATTEVNKVPVTVLSRCQRFDLRRIPSEKLAEHFANVARAEGVDVEEEALQAIATAAEGSARDGLSILDQAIAHGEGRVTADQVRDMLGQADRGRVRRLLETLLSGQVAETIAQLDEAHSLGIDPGSLIRGLMESLHAVTRAKAGAGADLLQSAEEREHGAELAARLSWGNLHRLWQLLLKGLEDVRIAPDPQEAATMALLRLIHAAEMPDPSQLAAMLAGGAAPTVTPSSAPPAPTASPSATALIPSDFPALVDAVERQGKQLLGVQLRDHVGLVSFAPGEIILKPLKPLGAEFARELAAAAKQVTGQSWEVRLTDEGGSPSLQQQEVMAEERMRAAVLEEPNVKALLDEFPDATLETIDRKEA